MQRLAGAKTLLLIYDKNLLRLPVFTHWLSAFPQSLGVDGGESLKSIDALPGLVRRILPMVSGQAKDQCALIAIGGGSIGDAAGFLASVIKRGIGLVHVPSTWIAAVDSAYGGKTAFNVDQFKNQVGTFYPAQAVLCVRDLLIQQPDENLISGYGEAFKMALIAGGDVFQRLNQSGVLNGVLLWRLLPELAREKMRVVKSDPFETSGRRVVLNLGHTFGHAIELIASERDIRLSHGAGVRIGTEFAIRLGLAKKITSPSAAEEALLFLAKLPKAAVPPFSKQHLARAILNDKKMAGEGLVNFVFVKKPGQPIVKKIGVSEICDFAQSIGWAN